MRKPILPIVIALLLMLPMASHSADIPLPDIGAGSRQLSPEEEQKLGEAFMRMVRQELAVMEDPEIIEYVWNLGYGLVANSDFREQQFHFFTVQDPTINAFAGPAGYIGIHSGLILTAENEGELAAVIAHEIAHVTQRHLDRAFDASEKMSIPTLAAIVTAIVLGSRNTDLAMATIMATQAASLQTQLNFTRSHEREADHIGMQVLAGSGFDPHSMPAFFERLQSTEDMNDSVPEFLRTHPVTVNRISESRARANQYTGINGRDSLLFHLIREKIRVMGSNNLTELLRYYESHLKAGTYQNELAHRYGYAQALLASHQYEQAKQQVHILIDKDRERISYSILLAQIEIARGEEAAGLHIFDEALTLNPSNPVLAQHYATALLRHDQPHKAAQVLLSVDKERRTPVFLKLLAQAERDSGHAGQSHRLLAEYYFQNGYTRTAIDQLNLALKEGDLTPTEKTIVEARLQELKQIALQEVH